MANKHFVLVESAEEGAEAGPALCWNGYEESTCLRSVPRHLDLHAERLRARYLAFTHDLGEQRVGKRVVDHFRIETGFSLWWMNRVTEKSPFKSDRIYDCLRLMALEEMLLELRPAMLTVYTADSALAEAIELLCQALSIKFDWAKRPSQARGWSIRRLYDSMPHVVRGILSFRHSFKRWAFRKLRPLAWASGDRTVFICSYFFNLDQAAAARGKFHSRQWEALPGWLASEGIRVNFLHHYLPDAGMRDVQTSLGWVERFNSDPERQGTHALLETFLSWPLMMRVFRRFARLWLVGWRLRNIGEFFRPAGHSASLWPLLREDWHNSLFGTAAVSNCFWVELFDTAMRDVPLQKQGLYLYEGQGWETAFIHAWRRYGHGELIGVPHFSMPFWYLNLYDDPRCSALERACDKPLPDRFAVNGKMGWRGLTKAGMPAERLLEAEALRFQYLLSVKPKVRQPDRARGEQRRKILVLGDAQRAQTIRMLRCVAELSRRLPGKVEVTLKLHPACPIETKEIPGLDCARTDRPLLEIIEAFDFALSANSTTAGLDALLAGVPVAVFLDDGLNLSPLRGVDGVHFVSSAGELVDALQASEAEFVQPRAGEYFWLDEQLPRWRHVLFGRKA